MWAEEGLYVPRFPVSATIPIPRSEEFEDCYHNRTELNMYYMRAPWGRQCDECKHQISKGDSIMGDCYFQDETGLFLCQYCARNEGSIRAHLKPRGELDVDMTEVVVVDASADMINPEACLLAPHSDNGFPRAREGCTEHRGPIYVTLDAQREVLLKCFRNHNWYHHSYAACVSIWATSLDHKKRRESALFMCCCARFAPSSLFSRLPRVLLHVIGRMMLEPDDNDWWQILEETSLQKASQWQDIPLKHYVPARYFKVVYDRAFLPSSPITVGCLQLE